MASFNALDMSVFLTFIKQTNGRFFDMNREAHWQSSWGKRTRRTTVFRSVQIGRKTGFDRAIPEFSDEIETADIMQPQKRNLSERKCRFLFAGTAQLVEGAKGLHRKTAYGIMKKPKTRYAYRGELHNEDHEHDRQCAS